MTTQDLKCSRMTKACLLNRLKQHLASIEREEGKYDYRKYYNQADKLLKIAAFKPVPYYIVYLSDLSPELMTDLYNLHSRDNNKSICDGYGYYSRAESKLAVKVGAKRTISLSLRERCKSKVSGGGTINPKSVTMHNREVNTVD